MPSVLPLPYGAADSWPRRRGFNARTGSRSDFPLLWRGGARRARECSTAGGTAADPVSVRLTSIFPSASVPHCSRRAIFRRRGTKPSGDAGQGAPSLLLVFNNSVRRSRPSCCRPVGAHVMSGELVKLALAGAAASVLIWVLSFLAPHCVPEHVGHLIQLAAC